MPRSTYSLFAKLVTCFGALALVLLVIGSMAIWQTRQLASEIVDLGRTRLPAMHAVMDADMMHDAIRGTVYAALKAHVDQNSAGIDAARKESEENMARLEADMTTLTKLRIDAETQQLLATSQPDITTYFQAARRVMSTLDHSTEESAEALKAFEDAFGKLEKSLGHFSDRLESNSEAAVTQSLADSARSQWLVSGIVICGFFFSIGLGLIFSRRIVNGLQKILGHLSITSADTSLIVSQLTAAGGKLADRASSDAAALEQSSASLEQLASMSKHNTTDAASARQEAQNTLSAADGGGQDLAAMQEAMQSIKAASQNIAAIIKTIDEIAFQTNILALNAAVEAARAGEAGLGFAVVADEVRSLAQRSALAAKETAAKIEDALQKSERGAVISQQLAGSFSVIVGKVREVEGFVAKIANASIEQNEGIQQVNSAISSLERGTQENAATAQESAAAGMELQSQVDALHKVALALNNLLGVQATTSVVAARRLRPSDQPSTRPSPLHEPSPS